MQLNNSSQLVSAQQASVKEENYPLLDKLAEAGVVGRGGASFPTDKKWLRLKQLDQPVGYVVCNASEGEPGVKKDLYILENYPAMVLAGMVTAMDFLNCHEAYFNINRNYYQLLGEKLKDLAKVYEDSKGYHFHFFIEEPSYIGGETGALLNAIEGKRTQPRLSPPSPSLTGIFGKPVLVNNVETFYDVARVVDGSFEPTRFVTITGEASHPGVYQLHRDSRVLSALQITNNIPNDNYFVQVGGIASGEVISQEMLENYQLTGCGSIDIYLSDAKPYDVLMRWFEFYFNESCGKCTPCREGSYQLYQLLKNLQFGEDMPWQQIKQLVSTMKITSVCDLGKSLAIPVESYIKNILKMEI